MGKKIRVHELARELGMSSKDALDLCIAMGIGVKSHSSSIEDAQADRVRRRIQSQQEKTSSLLPGNAQELDSSRETTPQSSSPAVGQVLSDKPESASVSVAPILEEPSSRDHLKEPLGESGVGIEEKREQKQRVQREEEQKESREGDLHEGTSVVEHKPSQPSSRRVISSHPAQVPSDKPLPQRPLSSSGAPIPPPPRLPRPAGSATPSRTIGSPAAPGARHPVSGEIARPSTPPRGAPEKSKTTPLPPPTSSMSKPDRTAPDRTAPGRVIRPLLSPSGKLIPPPPGGPPRPSTGQTTVSPRSPGGSRRAGSPSGGGSQGSPRRPNPSSDRAPARPSSRGDGQRSGDRAVGGAGAASKFSSLPSARGRSVPTTRPPMPPAPPSRGTAAGRGRAVQRRPKRRRRDMEELEPTQLSTTYTPSTAPVPDYEVIVERGCTAQELAPKLNRTAGDVIRFLLLQGEMVTATQSLTDDMIELFAAEIGAQIKLVDAGEEKEALLRAKYFSDEDSQDMASAVPRPPIVTVMGHVDHGKTLLLDKIRHSNTVAGEAGGITQHIGAYQVQVGDQRITFIDTPGHEAFTAMRARGAQVTDIVVLVVAADDGVMPQTVEAIDHARSAQVPIVVAINKIDKAGADIDRVLHQLAEHGLLAEKWGGDTITVEISALTGEGINDLLEHLLLVAELEELKATPEGRARGVVLEANLEVGRGPVATVIVQQGTLRVGDPLVAGAAWGKVKALVNDKGEMVKEALPSTPVEVLGWSEPPIAGEEFRVTADLSVARTIGETRAQRGRFMLAGQGTSVSPGAKLEDIFEQIQRGETATLNLILKADVQGSLEAVSESLRKLEREGIKLTFVHRGVGAITENDVQLASVSNATVIGFNVRPDRRARELANERSVEIRTYEVIYKLVEDMEAAMAGMLAPSMEEVVTGEAEVRAVFRVPRVGAVAGCYVRSGTITRGSKVRFLRDGVVIWKGTITSLKRFKDDVREVATGFECGIGLSDYQDLKEGDIIETFEEREREST